METITLTILIKDNKIKGILSPITSIPNSHWWDEEKEVTVPKTDWGTELVTTSTILKYMKPGEIVN